MRAILMAVMMTGCFQSPEIELAPVAPEEYVADWDAEVTAAITIWQSTIAPCHLPVAITESGNEIRLTDSPEWPLDRGGFDDAYLPDGTVLVLGDRPTGHRDVLLRAIGRLLGMAEQEDPGSIMFRATHFDATPSRQDVSAMRSLLGC